LKIRITETRSDEWFDFEVLRDSKLWGSSSALKQIFDALGLKQPDGDVRYALVLGREDRKRVVPDVAVAKNLTWADLGANDGDQYLLESSTRGAHRQVLSPADQLISNPRVFAGGILLILVAIALAAIGVYSLSLPLLIAGAAIGYYALTH
jgi:hypothetical protein